jgi:thioredoxin-like negative regulator of GroEL
MREVTDAAELAQLQAQSAVFILFGGAHCQVCNTLRPKLEALLVREFPRLEALYVDCARSPELCAQCGVFSLPVVQAWIGGGKVAEAARSFGIGELQRQLARPYLLWQADRARG